MDKFFFGSAISPVDEGGAIALPAAFIDTLKARQSDGVLFIGRHQDGQRLTVYDKVCFEDHQANVDWQHGTLVGGSKEAHDQFLRRTFAFVEKVELNDLGRIAIGPIMRERGRIDRAVLIVGAGDRFELWDLDNVIERGPYDLGWVAQRHLRARKMADHADSAMRPNLLPEPAPAATVAARKRPTAPLRIAQMPGKSALSTPTKRRSVMRRKTG